MYNVPLLLSVALSQHGKRIETISLVIDMENVSIQKHFYWPGIEILRAAFVQVENNSPEYMGRIFVVRGACVWGGC